MMCRPISPDIAHGQAGEIMVTKLRKTILPSRISDKGQPRICRKTSVVEIKGATILPWELA